MQISSLLTSTQNGDWKEVYYFSQVKMQVHVKKDDSKRVGNDRAPAPSLADLKRGETGILERLDLPEEESRRLMEMGFLPGHAVTPAHAAPGGDPRVFRVDGSEVALRSETARHLLLRRDSIQPTPKPALGQGRQS